MKRTHPLTWRLGEEIAVGMTTSNIDPPERPKAQEWKTMPAATEPHLKSSDNAVGKDTRSPTEASMADHQVLAGFHRASLH
jgi:hypothetical protein